METDPFFELGLAALNVAQTVALAYIANRSRRRRRHDDPAPQASPRPRVARVTSDRRRRPPSTGPGRSC